MRLRVVGVWLSLVVAASLAAAFLWAPDRPPSQARSSGAPLPAAIGPSGTVAPPRVAVVPPAPAPLSAPAPPRRAAVPSKAAPSVRAFDALPLRFESNVGQADERALFLARGLRSTLFLTSSDAVLSVAADGDEPAGAVRMSFVDPGPPTAVAGEEKLPGRTNYLVGAESEWRRDVVSYGSVRYREMYPGIDVVFHGRERELEFDVVVAAGADPARIAFDIDGADAARLDAAGDVVLEVGTRHVRLTRPVSYQESDGVRRPVESAFVLSGNRVAFRLGPYDRSEPLVIDPVMTYATYLGGGGEDAVRGIGTDALGNVYVAGTTSSSNFPTTAAFDSRRNDTFVAKLTPSGSALIYSTYLGGSLEDDIFGLAVDSAGQAYVVGRTSSLDFPLTAGAFDATPNGGTDAFLTKLAANGSALVYSTLLGTSGHDHAIDVFADDAGVAFVLGQAGAGGFPLTADAYYRDFFQGFFLSRFNTMAAGESSLEYSTFTGTTAVDAFAQRIDVAPDGDVLIAGLILDVNAVNGFQTSRTIDPRFGFPSADAAFLRVDTRAADPSQAVVYASYIGGGFTEFTRGIGAGPNGLVCLVGRAESGGFPVRGAFQPTVAGNSDAFVAVFDTSLQGNESLLYSTLLGGFSSDEALDCAFDTDGSVRVVGETTSTDFPLRAPFQATFGGGVDVFVAEIDPRLDGTPSLVNSSYYGGTNQEQAKAFHLGADGGVWIGGITQSTNLSLVNPLQPTSRGRDEGFLLKLEDEDDGGGGGGDDDDEVVVTAVAPSRGGAAHVTIVVHGVGFTTGATVRLVRGTQQVIADPVTFIDSNALQATVDLSGQALGAWDIVVTNPDATTATLAAGFSIEPITAVIRASASIVMNPVMRFGRPAAGYITYTNPTNVDVMLPIFIYFPLGKTLDFGIPIRHAPTIPTDQPVDFSQMPLVFDTGTEQVVPLIVNVPPGHTGVIPITIREGCDPLNPTSVRVAVGTPRTRTESMTCAHALISIVLSAIPITDCLGDILGLLNNAVGVYTGEPASMGSWIADILLAAVKCAAATTPIGATIQLAIQVAEIAAFADDTLGVLEACSGGMRPTGPGYSAADRSCVRSADPNAKYGPSGAGEARYVTGADPMSYIIAFENLETATAAAQDVVVTDTLDASRFDLDTFTLGPISFGSRTVIPPSGLSAWVTTVDLRPGVNLLLGIDARLDRATSVATWRFTSLDPATGQPTTDPIAGFLPPNVTSPEGEGTVMFTAAPVAALGTDDVVRNSASIVFDVNAPIVTGEWSNAIDKMTPTSAVAPLSSPRWSPSFEVHWSGADAGSGVADYTVFASVNGGPFTAWLSNTTATSAIYQGAFGNTYAFFSLARDRVGHVEGAKAVAEATVEVLLDTHPPVLTLPEPMAVNATGPAGAVVTFQASALDVVDGPRPVTCAPQSGATFALGVTTVTCTASDVRGNAGTGSFTVTVTDPPTPGKMVGSGRIDGAQGSEHRFSFEIRELDDGAHSGLFQVEVCTPALARPGHRCPHGVFASEGIAFARFSDDPATAAGPGREALPDTALLAGPGWWNGKSGYSFEVLATDRGEPGAGRDTIGIVVKAPGGATVATVSGVIRSGNLQAKPWQ